MNDLPSADDPAAADLRGRLDALYELASGRPREALEGLASLMDSMPSEHGMGHPEIAMRVAMIRARALIQTETLREALAHAVQGLRLAVQLDDASARGALHGLISSCFNRLGHLEPALRHSELAAELLAGRSPSIATRVRHDRATLLRAMGRISEAANAFHALLSEISPAHALRIPTLINAASTWRQVGRVDDAARALDEVDALLADSDRASLRAWSAAIRAWVSVDRGDIAAASAHAGVALALAEPSDLGLRSSGARALLAAAMLPDAPGPVVARAVEVGAAVARDARLAPVLGVAIDVARALADLAERRGEPATAVRWLRDAEDLAERRRVEAEQLRLQSDDLQVALLQQQLDADHLYARIDAVTEENRGLRELDAARVAQVQAISHDLRGPMTNLLTAAYLADPADRDAVAALRAEVIAAVDRMVGMMDRFLSDAAMRDGGGRLLAEPVDLGPWITRAVRSFEPLAARRGLRLVLDIGAVPAACDPVAVCRIVDNLVSNALKFVPAGGTVTVRAILDDAELRFVVEDDGPGFPSDDPTRALLRGDRLGAAGVTGSGVGLHNVYDLATRLGGFVELGNRPEGGARARVRLPRPR